MTTGFEYFDRMYQEPDPWSFESSDYERRKYALTIGALPRARYRRTFEPGCSIGVLSARIASRTDELVAGDLHPAPLEQARERLADRPGVTVVQLEVPGEWPSGSFDLIVLSEIAYYFGDDDLRLLRSRVTSSLDPGGDLVLVHWRGETDYPQTGDQVHELWLDDPRFRSLSQHLEPMFRLDVMRFLDEQERR